MGTLPAPQQRQQQQKQQQKQQQQPARAPAAGPMLLLFLLLFLLLLLLLGGWKCSHAPPRNRSWTFLSPSYFWLRDTYLPLSTIIAGSAMLELQKYPGPLQGSNREQETRWAFDDMSISVPHASL